MLKVGLTGGMGSGKSTLAHWFAEWGAFVYNSDLEAKKLYLDPAIKSQVIYLLGAQAYTQEGLPDTKFIAQTVFPKPDLTKSLNALLHPWVGKGCLQSQALAQKEGYTLWIQESALLYESGAYKNLDLSILVETPLDLRIQRVQKSRGLSETEIFQRLQYQGQMKENTIQPDYILNNTGDLPAFKAQAQELWLILQKKC